MFSLISPPVPPDRRNTKRLSLRENNEVSGHNKGNKPIYNSGFFFIDFIIKTKSDFDFCSFRKSHAIAFSIFYIY